MNSNVYSNGSNSRSRGSNIQYFQDSYSAFPDASHAIQQQQSKRKPSHGIRKLHHYRRKLPEQSMSSTAITSSIVPRQTTTQVDTTIKKQDLPDVHISEPNPCTAVESSEHILYTNTPSIGYTNIPDQVFSQMLTRAYQGSDKPDLFLDEKDKITFLHHYTGLIDRLSYVKLQLQQWNYYYHLGMTKGIWTERISKYLAERNSICYTYGRSKAIIQQRLRILQTQLEKAQNNIQLYENALVLQVGQHTNCSSEMKALFLIISAFVSEHQQKLRDEFEHKRQMLVLDATDHHLLRKFFDSKPNRSQMSSAARIWQATVKQTALEKQVAIMEHRRTARAVLPSSTIFERMLDDIDTQIAEAVGVIDLTASRNYNSSESGKLRQLQQDIVRRIITSGRVIIADYATIIHREKQNFFVKTNTDEHTLRIHVAVLDAIELRRLHMVERAKYITQQKLLSDFK